MVSVGHGCGQVVSVVLAFPSDDPNSNPAEVSMFLLHKLLLKNENKQKEAGMAHLKRSFTCCLLRERTFYLFDVVINGHFT